MPCASSTATELSRSVRPRARPGQHPIALVGQRGLGSRRRCRPRSRPRATRSSASISVGAGGDFDSTPVAPASSASCELVGHGRGGDGHPVGRFLVGQLPDRVHAEVPAAVGVVEGDVDGPSDRLPTVIASAHLDRSSKLGQHGRQPWRHDLVIVHRSDPDASHGADSTP